MERATQGTLAIEVRPIRPEDRTRIADAVTYTSVESYYRRFHVFKHGFSKRELSRLTELDGGDQFALIATEHARPERLVAVARLARDPGNRADAELAIIVHDPYQRLGIGRRMLELLVDAARERGITHLSAFIQADNHAMIGLLLRVLPQATLDEREGPVCTFGAHIGRRGASATPAMPGVISDGHEAAQRVIPECGSVVVNSELQECSPIAGTASGRYSDVCGRRPRIGDAGVVTLGAATHWSQ